jgi:hypothetical protein
VLEVTPAGTRVLAALTADHTRELTELGPQLIQALRACIALHPPGRSRTGTTGE